MCKVRLQDLKERICRCSVDGSCSATADKTSTQGRVRLVYLDLWPMAGGTESSWTQWPQWAGECRFRRRWESESNTTGWVIERAFRFGADQFMCGVFCSRHGHYSEKRDLSFAQCHSGTSKSCFYFLLLDILYCILFMYNLIDVFSFS